MDHNQQRETNKETECLLEQALGGDREALDKLLASYRLSLYRQALRIVGNPEDAEDALQNAFLNAVCHLNQFEGRSKFSTWLTRVVINAAAMVRRSKHSQRAAPLEDCLPNDDGEASLEIADVQPDPEQVCSSSQINALVNEQFNLLSPGLRSAFQLRHIDGLSCVKAAQSLGISVSAVKSRVNRARRQLAESLNHAYLGPVPKTQCGVIAARAEVMSRNVPHSVAR
jgi:RNA polymerase sigma-70 factor (ECF subfamily)